MPKHHLYVIGNDNTTLINAARSAAQLGDEFLLPVEGGVNTLARGDLLLLTVNSNKLELPPVVLKAEARHDGARQRPFTVQRVLPKPLPTVNDLRNIIHEYQPAVTFLKRGALIFGGERFAVSSWRDVTYLTAVGIAQLLGDQFSSFVENLPNNFKLEPFKYASRQLSSSRQLNNGYWVNLNFSVAAARSFCRSMLSSAGIAEDEWQVDFTVLEAAAKKTSSTGNSAKANPASPVKAQTADLAAKQTKPVEDFATAEIPDFQPLEQQFNAAMRTTYEDAVQHGYIPARFLQMLNERGGIGTARYLLAKPDTQQGLFKLWELGQLDSSMEALVLQPKYEALFTDEEHAEARRRLEELGFFK